MCCWDSVKQPFKKVVNPHLADSVIGDQDVASCQVSVDEIFPGEVAHARGNLVAETETRPTQLALLWGAIGRQRERMISGSSQCGVVPTGI